MIRVLIVDDHRLVREGLRTLLGAAGDIDVVGTAADGAEVVETAAKCEPHVVLMDLSMPGVDGITATRLLRAERPDVRVVALTTFSENQQVAAALEAGAVGYLLKDSTPETLFEAVRSAFAGHAPIDPRVAAALLPGRRAQATDADALSTRELEVLRLVSKGLANKQIARALGISEHTVKIHLGNVFRRIGVTDRTSAAMWARDNLPQEASR